MDLDKLILGILAFSLIIVAGTLIIVDINDNYSNNEINISTDEFGDVYDTVDELQNKTTDMRSAIFGGEVEDENTENSMFRGVFSALKSVRIVFELIGDIVNSIAKTLPIPPIFVAFTITGLAIIIIFAFVYIIFRIAKS